jgi:hypothetical protein
LSDQSYSDRIDEYFKERAKSAQQYFETTNQFLGILAFSLGIGCLGTESSREFAALSLILVTLAWRASIKRLKSDLNELKYVDHESLKVWNVVKNTYLSIAALVFLVAVAAGEITTTGILS